MTGPGKTTIRVWQILVSAAMNRQTIQYGQITGQYGYLRPAPVGIRRYLDPIAHYCRNKRLPAITTLAVDIYGHVGEMPAGVTNLEEEREKVFAHNWFAEIPPTF